MALWYTNKTGRNKMLVEGECLSDLHLPHQCKADRTYGFADILVILVLFCEENLAWIEDVLWIPGLFDTLLHLNGHRPHGHF
jgi:hypothetical protein